VAFRESVQTWHDFYTVAGAASATLMGLLFVALSLHLRIVVSHPEVKSLARVTLADFFVVLLISLFLAIPTGQAIGTGIEMLGTAAASIWLMARPAVVGVRNRRARRLGPRVLIFRFGLTALAYMGLGAVGVLFLVGDFEDALGWSVTVVIVLLLVAVRNTWDLLVTVADQP
jgi:hypothetical protein